MLILEQPYTLPALSWPVIGALLLLIGWSTVLAFVVYYWVMERTSASTLSLVTYLIPVVATVLGVIVLHEQLGWNTYLGYALIILGAMIVNGVIGLAGWRSFGRSWRRAPISS